MLVTDTQIVKVAGAFLPRAMLSVLTVVPLACQLAVPGHFRLRSRTEKKANIKKVYTLMLCSLAARSYSYAQQIVEKEGVTGLMGRGLGTKLISNGMQVRICVCVVHLCACAGTRMLTTLVCDL